MRTIKRRRLEGKTDYAKRIKLLKSETPRLVTRRTNRYFMAQYVVSKEAQDKILIGLDSRILIEYGWPKNSSGSLKSTSAAYLLGMLMGKEIKKKKLQDPIVDLGMAKIIHKSRNFAFIKGLIDSGVKISCEKDDFPSEERIEGKHMKNKIPFVEILKKISASTKLETQNFADREIKSKIKSIK